jgi:glycosyltransferase involved in cell wall biosynthesis
VNTHLFHPAERDPGEKPTVLWVGRHVAGKGVEHLIRGFSLVAPKIPDLTLVLIGDGPLRDAAEQQVRDLGLDSQTEFIGNVPYDLLPQYYRRASIFVLPSLQEGVPRTMLEAMACERAVIISQFAHLESIVAGAGMMFPKGDAGALASAMHLLLKDENLAKDLGRKGREKIVQNYSFENTVRCTVDLYNQLLREGGSAQ